MPIQWTDEQQVILAHDGNRSARVLAGPGTGKSATMVEWVGQILNREDSPGVKMLTFTRAATSELTKKVAEHETTATLKPSTVHSFAISVLLQNPGVAEFPEPLRIADDWESTKIIHPTLGRRIRVQPRRIRDLFTELAANWEALEEREDEGVDAEERARFLAAWQEHRRIYGYTLLSELPWALRRALRNHPDLEGVAYDLLVVDEYQDLNACDLQVLGLLSERGTGVVAVGDDDQSIYSFRRAAPAGIRRFPEEYPGSSDYPLSITHRCGSRIMEWAGDVIVRDTGRDQEKPTPNPSEGSPDGDVALLSFAGHSAEPVGIAQLVENLIDREQVPPSEILVLLRSDHNGQFSRPIKAALDARGIAYADPDAIKDELARPENRQLIACCRLLANRTDSLAWATLLNLTSGIGPSFVDWIYGEARRQGIQFGESLLTAFENGFVGAPRSSGRAHAFIDSVLQWIEEHQIPEDGPEVGWGNWITTIGGAGPAPAATEEFAAILAGVDSVIEPDEGFSSYLSQITPLARDQAQAVSDQVRIMTMAASKGLTVEATIVAAAEEGVTPSRKPGVDVNEECRLLYVAMTRAKRFLYCTWARRRTGATARAGQARVNDRRNYSSFFEGGPVQSRDGLEFIRERWPK